MVSEARISMVVIIYICVMYVWMNVILGVQTSFTRFIATFFFFIYKNEISNILIKIGTIDFYYSLPTLRQLMDPTSTKVDKIC